jgi:hypothetical protein
MALEGGGASASRPGRSLLPGKTRYPLYTRLDGPQGRSGEVRKISPPPGLDSRTVQPLASRYNDYATRPTNVTLYTRLILHISIIVLRHLLPRIIRQTERNQIIKLLIYIFTLSLKKVTVMSQVLMPLTATTVCFANCIAIIYIWRSCSQMLVH